MSLDALSSTVQRALREGALALSDDGSRITYRLGRTSSPQLWAHPEERIRAQCVASLLYNYHYPPTRILVEFRIPHRTPNNWADIVVFADARRTKPYLTVECTVHADTEPQYAQKIEQAFGYANSIRSQFVSVFSSRFDVWSLSDHGAMEREDNHIADLPVNYGTIPEYHYVRGAQSDLNVVDMNALSHTLRACHNILWAGGRNDPVSSFDQISRLIFAKLFDESDTPDGAPYRFQYGTNESDSQVADRIRALFHSAVHERPGVFSGELAGSDTRLCQVVTKLQGISFEGTDPDAKGRAYEQFLGSVFRGELGQYFTQRTLIDFLIAMVQPSRADLVLDPACGSGGFLVHVMKSVFAQIARSYSNKVAAVRQQTHYATTKLHGIEINDRIARVAMMGMVIHEDGKTNITVDTALRNTFSSSTLVDNNFDLILTNPPFGDKISRDDLDKLGDAYLSEFVLSRGQDALKSEIAFVERCTRFLRPGGYLGIVLPDGILNTKSCRHVREYLLREYRMLAVVSLPDFAFRTAKSGMSTSILVARKERSGGGRVCMAIARRIGYDATGRPDENELPGIAASFASELNGEAVVETENVMWIGQEAVAKTKGLRLDAGYYFLRVEAQRDQERISNGRWQPLRSLLSEPMVAGKSPPGGSNYSYGDVPTVLVGDLMTDGRVTDGLSRYVSTAFFDALARGRRIRPFDILIAKDGATTGKVAMVSENFPHQRCAFNEHIFRLRIESEIDREFVFYFLMSAEGQRQIQLQRVGGAQSGIVKDMDRYVMVPQMGERARLEYVRRCRRGRRAYLEAMAKAECEYTEFVNQLSVGLTDPRVD